MRVAVPFPRTTNGVSNSSPINSQLENSIVHTAPHAIKYQRRFTCY